MFRRSYRVFSPVSQRTFARLSEYENALELARALARATQHPMIVLLCERTGTCLCDIVLPVR